MSIFLMKYVKCDKKNVTWRAGCEILLSKVL